MRAIRALRLPSTSDHITQALQLLSTGETLTLDESPASARLAAELPTDRHLTVLTTGLTVVLALTNRPGVTVILLPGHLDRSTQSVIAPPDLQTLPFRSTHGFFGASAFTSACGLMERTAQLARTKRLLLATCREPVATISTVAVDQFGPYVFATPDEISTLHVIDAAPAVTVSSVASSDRLPVAEERATGQR